jgi:hypothetical protein
MDTAAEQVLRDLGQPAGAWDSTHTRLAMQRTASALSASLSQAQPVTHVGWGTAPVERVVSNRRVPGPNGRLLVRYTTEKNPEKRAAPEGTIDPAVDVVSFWNGDVPLAVLSYYACHPQSYYLTGVPSPDFPASPASSVDRPSPGPCTSTSAARPGTSARANTMMAPRSHADEHQPEDSAG